MRRDAVSGDGDDDIGGEDGDDLDGDGDDRIAAARAMTSSGGQATTP
jgi:hypothetical protein